jgi:hypothetical protein
MKFVLSEHYGDKNGAKLHLGLADDPEPRVKDGIYRVPVGPVDQKLVSAPISDSIAPAGTQNASYHSDTICRPK